jgi:ABC-type amino acid transport system permease subunit
MLGLILHSSAFICEIVRGALASVDMRQLEAAHSIGE